MQTLQDQGLTPDLPPAGLAAHLIGYLFEAGPGGAGAMGPTVLGWKDMDAWQHVTGIELTAWEARTLRRLSADYLGARDAAQDADAPAPYAPVIDTDRRDRVAAQVRAIFGNTRKH